MLKYLPEVFIVVNVLIIGDENAKSLPMVLKSKYLSRLYTNFEYPNLIDIKFNTFKELARKCKALKIDIVLVEDKKLILQGIVDVLRKNFVNCIGVSAKWTNLVLSRKFAGEILQKYDIDVPEKFLYPKEFPLMVKADGFSKTAGSMEEVIQIRQEIFNYSPEIAKTVFLEKYIDGEKYNLTSLYDGKTLITLPAEGLAQDKTEEYNKKLHLMLKDENADFIGYINSSVIFSGNRLFNIGFNFEFPELNTDVLFVLHAMIYQKLDEIDLLFSKNI